MMRNAFILVGALLVISASVLANNLTVKPEKAAAPSDPGISSAQAAPLSTRDTGQKGQSVQPIDNDDYPKMQALKIHDPDYSAEKSFE